MLLLRYVISRVVCTSFQYNGGLAMKFINDLKQKYHLIFESALILSLLLIISAFKFPTDGQEPLSIPKSDFDVVKTVDTPITNPPEKPPAPPKPSVLQEVPNDQIIKESIDDLDINWESDGKLDLPPEPTSDEPEEKIFRKVEQEPHIKGGMQSLYDDITYPRAAKIAGIEGIVHIQFVIDKDGSVKNAKVLRGIGGGCDKEALRAVQNLSFEPGRQRGIPVQVKMTLPVRFQLQ